MKSKLKPNLFIIGAMKSGTSSLHSWLSSHPDIFMCEPKEPCYFVERTELDWPYIEQQGFWRGEDHYLRLFRDAGNAAIIGESSTLYSKAPRCSGVPQRIAQFNPQARIIYLMRDPVERTISHYWHMVNHHAEFRDMLDAVVEDAHYRQVSHYAMQLRSYLELFGPDQVLTLTFETLIRQPACILRQIFQWLGVDDQFVPFNLDQSTNITPRHVNKVRGRGLLHQFRGSTLWEALGPRVPRTIRRWGVRLSERSVDRQHVSHDDVVSYLKPIQREQTRELSEMLSRSFDEWSTLNERPSPVGVAAGIPIKP